MGQADEASCTRCEKLVNDAARAVRRQMTSSRFRVTRAGRAIRAELRLSWWIGATPATDDPSAPLRRHRGKRRSVAR